MSVSVLEKDSGLESRMGKTKKLALSVKVVGNATPASKVLSSDLPSVVIMSAEGQVSNVPAGVTTVTPADATGLYSVILDLAAIGPVNKVLKVDVVNITSTHTAAFSLSNGYIVIDLDSSSALTSGLGVSECILIIQYISK